MTTKHLYHYNEAPLRCFTKNTLSRIVIVMLDKWKDEVEVLAHDFTNSLNTEIQDINMRCAELNIPYFSIQAKRCKDKSISWENVRAIYRHRKKYNSTAGSCKSTIYLPDKFSKKHLADLLFCSDYQIITYSSDYSFKALGDLNTLYKIMSDVFLDEAMLSAYIGKQRFSDEEIYMLNKHKIEFIEENSLSSVYRIDKEDLEKISSLSIASFCRTPDSFSIDKYLNLWARFMNRFFQNSLSKIASLEKQLEFHLLYDQLPDDIVSKAIEKPAGAYLLLRVHKEPTSDNRKTIDAIFGRDASIGRIKMVSLTEYYKEDYYSLIQNMEVSAFKIIVVGSD